MNHWSVFIMHLIQHIMSFMLLASLCLLFAWTALAFIVYVAGMRLPLRHQHNLALKN